MNEGETVIDDLLLAVILKLKQLIKTQCLEKFTNANFLNALG